MTPFRLPLNLKPMAFRAARRAVEMSALLLAALAIFGCLAHFEPWSPSHSLFDGAAPSLESLRNALSMFSAMLVLLGAVLFLFLLAWPAASNLCDRLAKREGLASDDARHRLAQQSAIFQAQCIAEAIPTLEPDSASPSRPSARPRL